MYKPTYHQRLFQTNKGIERLAFPLFLLVILVIAYVVYHTGGIKFVYSHSMYLPILLSGFIYGVPGGILIAVIGGLALGPYMPIDSVSGEKQETLNWIYRTIFFSLVGILSGIASQSVRAHIKRLEWDSRHDINTGLRNRAALLEDLIDLGSWKHKSTFFTLTVVTFDNMADLRTAFGIDVVEDIVRQAAERSQSAHGPHVGLYRSSPEQIAAIVAASAIEEIESFLDDLVKLFQSPFQIGQVAVHADARIGYVRGDVSKQVVGRPETLLLEAEAASLAAHRSGQNSVHYSAAFMSAVKENLSLLGDLRRAMENGELSLHYQPKITMSSGKVCGAEALIRWRHPQRGWIPPGLFIPYAEQSTLIQAVVEFTLMRSLEQITQWLDQGICIPVALNVSPRNLIHPGFVDNVLSCLDQYGVEGDLLELEITEGALMTDMERMIGELNRLAKHGVRISVDDFGTGYSSLQYLHRLPISHLKIDQSFVKRALTDDGASHIIESAVSLAHRMHIKAIAEGIENQATYDLLARQGCDIAQGFAISHPLPEHEFVRWYAQHEKGFLLTKH